MNLRVHGTLGLLLRSVRRGLKSANEIKACLKSIRSSSTLYIKATLIQSAIKELEKFYG